MQLASLPALRQPLEDGLFGGVITLADGTHQAVIWLNNVKAPRRLAFDAAGEWATEAGGQLPTPTVASMLVTNLGELLPQIRVWTNKEEGSACAWYCGLYDGTVSFLSRSAELGAVAVRRVFP